MCLRNHSAIIFLSFKNTSFYVSDFHATFQNILCKFFVHFLSTFYPSRSAKFFLRVHNFRSVFNTSRSAKFFLRFFKTFFLRFP